MADAFHRGRDGKLHAQLHPRERALLEVLASQLRDIIGESPASTPASSDPFEALVAQLSQEVERPAGDVVHARLFPRAHREDAEVADEFDRAALAGLRDGRAARTAAFLETLSAPDAGIHLTIEQAHMWLTVLTDLRLMIGTSVGIEEDDPRRDDPDASPHEAMYISVYDWLSWLQETLVACFL